MNKKTYKRMFAIGVAIVLFLGGIGIIQNILDNYSGQFKDEAVAKIEKKEKDSSKEEKKEETLKAPVKNGIGIVRYYYNKDDDASKQEQSLILFEDVYKPNQGVDYAYQNQSFEVLASMSGKVTKKTNDPVLGWVVSITNDNNICTTYESLSKVNVELNQTVNQDDLIGMSGENIYEADLKNHLHFSLSKNEVLYNPEKYIGQPLNSIK